MPTPSQPKTSASNAHHALPGEVGMAVAWMVFYAMIVVAPLAAKIAPVGTVIALLSK